MSLNSLVHLFIYLCQCRLMVAYFIQHAVQSHVIYFDAQIVYVFPLELLAILYHSLIIFLLSVTKKMFQTHLALCLAQPWGISDSYMYTCVCMSVYICMCIHVHIHVYTHPVFIVYLFNYIGKHECSLIRPIPTQHHRVYSSFPPFQYTSLLWQWETRTPLSPSPHV